MEIGRHWGMIANEHIKIYSNSHKKVKTFKYLGSLLTNQNFIQEEIKCRQKTGNSCYYSVQTLLSSRLLSKNLKIKIYKTIILPAVYLWSMVSYIKGGIQAKGIWKQDHEADNWNQEGCEWWVEKAPQSGTS